MVPEPLGGSNGSIGSLLALVVESQRSHERVRVGGSATLASTTQEGPLGPFGARRSGVRWISRTSPFCLISDDLQTDNGASRQMLSSCRPMGRKDP